MPSKKIPTLLQCECGTEKIVQCLSNRDYSKWKCLSCSIKSKWQDESYRAERKRRAKPKSIRKKTNKTCAEISVEISKAAELSWANKESRIKRLKALQDCKTKRTDIAKKMWEKDGFVDKYKTLEHRAKMREIALRNWDNPELRKKQGEISKKLWSNDEYRRKILASKSTIEFKQKMAAIQSNPIYKEKLAKALAKRKSTPSDLGI